MPAGPRNAARNAAQTSINIAAPPETVWRLITTIGTIADWYDTWDGVKHDAPSPNLELGSSFQLFRRRPGRRDDTVLCRVTNLSAPDCLEWLESSPNTATVTVRFVLVPQTDGSTTELQHTKIWAAP